MSAQAGTVLPRLLDRRQIAAELGVTLAGAETIMRGCEKVRVGRRVYVTETEVRAYLKRESSR